MQQILGYERMLRGMKTNVSLLISRWAGIIRPFDQLKGWQRFLLLLMALVVVNVVTAWVLSANYQHAIYRFEDSAVDPEVVTLACSVLVLPFLLAVGFLPHIGSASLPNSPKRKRGLMAAIGILLLFLNVGCVLLCVLGLVYWCVREHLLVSLSYLLSASILAMLFASDLRQFFAASAKLWSAGYLAVCLAIGLALWFDGDRFVDMHPTPEELADEEASQGLMHNMVDSIVQAPDGTTYAGTARGVFRSTDGGVSWVPVIRGLKDVGARALAMTSGNVIYVGTNQKGVFKSTDKGAHWSSASHELTDAGAYSIVVAADGIIYAGIGGTLWRSTDNGENWMTVGAFPALDDASTEAGVQYFAVAGDGTLYVVSEDGQVFRSGDKGDNWTLVAKSSMEATVQSLVVARDGTIIAGTDQGVFRSVNGGAKWTPAKQGLGSPNVDCLALAPDNSIYVGTYFDGPFKSVDNGAHWAPIDQGLENRTVSSLAIASGDLILAGTDRGMFKSANGGATWVPASRPDHDSHSYEPPRYFLRAVRDIFR
jgi:photosystem II stability/assembly factor-like uncharacterized protein